MRRLAIGSFVAVVLLALTAAVGAGWYCHTCGIDVTAGDGTLPTRLHTCARDFDRPAPR